MQPELKTREEIEPIKKRFEDLQIRKGTKKVHPLDLVRCDGLWKKYQGKEKFKCVQCVHCCLDLSGA